MGDGQADGQEGGEVGLHAADDPTAVWDLLEAPSAQNLVPYGCFGPKVLYPTAVWALLEALGGQKSRTLLRFGAS